MRSKINEILKRMESLREELRGEYTVLAKKYGFSIKGKKIVFLETIRRYNRSLRENIFRYIFTAHMRQLLSLPFIYGMIVPIFFLDVFLFIYQTFAFPLYSIPKVRRNEYIVYDRQYLDYLNMVQKVHCLYCTYANGIFAYAVEIGARTEMYWCPVKAARLPRVSHAHYQSFADYGDPVGFNELFNNEKCFSKEI